MTDPPPLFLLTEAAERTGLTVDALRKRIRRGKLDTVKGNDGLVRVRLTSADMEALRLAEGQTGHPPASQPEATSRIVSALEAEVGALRDGLARERERADRAEAAAAVVPELRERAGRAEGETAILREQLAAERNRSVNQMREVEAVRDAARIDLAAWTAGGPFARAVRAFLNRRGRP